MQTGPAADVALGETCAGEAGLRERGVAAAGSASDSCLERRLFLWWLRRARGKQGNQTPKSSISGAAASTCCSRAPEGRMEKGRRHESSVACSGQQGEENLLFELHAQDTLECA